VKAAIFAVVLLPACAATVPLVEHDAALSQQKQEYEARLTRADEEKTRELKKRDAAADEAKKNESSLESRIDQLESALADKQRMLDDVTSQLLELQDAMAKLSSKERSKIETQTEREKAMKASVAAAVARFEEALKTSKAAIEGKEHGVLVRFKDGVLFARGSSKLGPASKETIEKLAAAIKSSEGAALKIDVHTDAIKGQDGWSLTDQQGAALVRALQKLGVDPSRLSYTSFGQYRPLATNDNEEGRAENRRIELFIELSSVLPKSGGQR
jgi:chemotaxis protein MotB